MRLRYQNVMAVRGAVWAMVSGLSPLAMRVVKNSGNIDTTVENSTIYSRNLLKVAIANAPLLAALAYDGINACTNAPSAKIRLKRLGSLKATRNMSLYIDCPKTEASNIVRTSPATLENRMPKLLEKNALNLICSLLIAF